jgi:dephospho-CoA kinase
MCSDKKMLVLGLTGSIGMGKSTVAAQLESEGARVCSADAIVHALLAKDGAAVAAVATQFPEVVKHNTVDRPALAAIVFHDQGKLSILERILHPLVVAAENDFIAAQRKDGARVTVLEIPLLYETGAQSRCDKIIVVTAPHFIQRRRVMARHGMTLEKFATILMLQMQDKEKRRRADYVVQTGLGRAYSLWQVKSILRRLHAA